MNKSLFSFALRKGNNGVVRSKEACGMKTGVCVSCSAHLQSWGRRSPQRSHSATNVGDKTADEGRDDVAAAAINRDAGKHHATVGHLMLRGRHTHEGLRFHSNASSSVWMSSFSVRWVTGNNSSQPKNSESGECGGTTQADRRRTAPSAPADALHTLGSKVTERYGEGSCRRAGRGNQRRREQMSNLPPSKKTLKAKEIKQIGR